MPRSRSPKNPSPARHPVLTYASPDIQDLLFYIEVDSTLKPWKTPVHGEFYKDKNGEFPNHVLVHVTSADENGWVKWYYAADRENQDNYNFEIVNGEYLRRTYIIPRDEYYSRHEDDVLAVVVDEFTYPDAGAATPDVRFPMYCFMDDTLARGEKELDSKYVVIQRRFVRPVEINYTYNDAFKKTVKVTKEVVPLTTTAPTLGAAGTIVEIQDGNLFHSIQITQELQLGFDEEDPPVAIEYPYSITTLVATQNYRFPTRMDSVGVVYVWAYADSPDHRSSYSENWYFNFQSTEPRTGPYDATIERYITDDVSAIKTTYPLDHIPQAIRENIGVARWWLTAGPKGNATSATAKEYTVPPSIHPVIPIDTGGLAIDVGANGGDGYENDELLETAGYGDFLTLLASGAVRIDYRVRELPFNLYEVSVVSLDVTNLYSAPSP